MLSKKDSCTLHRRARRRSSLLDGLEMGQQLLQTDSCRR